MKTSRRNFLVTLGMGLNAIAAALLAIPIIGYLGGALKNRGRDQAWIALGKIDAFPVGPDAAGDVYQPVHHAVGRRDGEMPCWVRRIAADRFQVFAINCTHLGCPVRWFPESGLFMCPCHGGVYYEDGQHASGPPPRRLYEYEYKIDGGQLMVRGGQLPTLAQGV
jgi:Rieske Fe-S protein